MKVGGHGHLHTVGAGALTVLRCADLRPAALHDHQLPSTHCSVQDAVAQLERHVKQLADEAR